MEGKMKKIKIMVMLGLFLGTAVGNLFSQYLDVGDDPELIKIINTTEISIPKGYEFKQWSPDGEFFTISNESYQDKELKTYIFNKSGQLYKQCGGYFSLWSPDSKKIVLIDSNKSKGVLIYDIVSYNTFKTSIQIKYVYNIHQFIDDKIIYNKNNEIYEYDIKLNSSTLFYKPNIKGEVDDIKINNNCLLYTQYLNINENPLFKYNMIDKKATKILSGFIVPIKYYLTKDKKIIIEYNDSNIYFLEEKGSVLFRFSDRLHGEQDIKQDIGFDISNSSLAPNGKLYAISYRHFDESEDIINSSDIYLVSLVSNKKYNLTNTSDKTELMKEWSPQGNRIVYLEFKSKKLIIAEIGK
jgi:dipeptidyl aminopeptidase/acylaminoacyl peptidase